MWCGSNFPLYALKLKVRAAQRVETTLPGGVKEPSFRAWKLSLEDGITLGWPRRHRGERPLSARMC